MGGSRKSRDAFWRFVGNRKAACLLLLLALFHLVCGFVIMHNHATPPTNHAAANIDFSLRVYDALKADNIRDALGVHHRYSPFLHFLAQPFYFLFGPGMRVSLGVNAFFFAILLASTYLLGKELFSEEAGLLAAFLISFYPQVYGMSRVYMPDFPLTALIALDLYLLLKTQRFTDRRFSLLFGFGVGVAELLKPVVLIYVAGPILAVFFSGFRRDYKQGQIRPRARNLLLGIIASQAVYLPWFMTGPGAIASDLIHTITMTTGSVPAHPPTFWELATYFITVILNYQALYFFGLLFLFSLLYLLLGTKSSSPAILFSSIFLLVPYAFFSFIMSSNRDPRFILPLAIGISIVSAGGVMGIRQKRVRTAVIALCIIVGMSQFIMLGFTNVKYRAEGDRLPFERVYFSPFIDMESTVGPLYEWNSGIFQASTNNLAQDEVLDILVEDAGDDGGMHVVLASQENLFSPLRYLPRLKEVRNLRVQLPFPGDPFPPEPDYYLLLSDSLGEGFCERNRCGPGETESVNWFESERESYQFLGAARVYPYATPCSEERGHSASCPTGGCCMIEIYKRRK